MHAPPYGKDEIDSKICRNVARLSTFSNILIFFRVRALPSLSFNLSRRLLSRVTRYVTSRLSLIKVSRHAVSRRLSWAAMLRSHYYFYYQHIYCEQDINQQMMMRCKLATIQILSIWGAKFNNPHSLTFREWELSARCHEPRPERALFVLHRPKFD